MRRRIRERHIIEENKGGGISHTNSNPHTDKWNLHTFGRLQTLESRELARIVVEISSLSSSSLSVCFMMLPAYEENENNYEQRPEELQNTHRQLHRRVIRLYGIVQYILLLL